MAIKGIKFTEEHKRKLSLSLKGKKRTDEQRKKMSEERIKRGVIPPSRLGSKQSDEFKKKMSLKMKGKKYALGMKHTEEWKLANSKRHKGEKSSLWKGGITPLNAKIRTSTEYKLWRKSVFERDNFTCVWCGEKGYLNADHIKPFAYFPELRFAIYNGRTLCRKCHLTTETYGNKPKVWES